MRTHRSDVSKAMKSISSESFRAQKLGSDDEGNEYWYFYGTRLYKQQPSLEKKSKDWEIEWNQKAEQVQKKRGRGRPRKIPSKPRKSDGESEEFEDAESGPIKKFMNIDEKSRWSVVCNTIEDWVNFADKLKNGTSVCEMALFEVIQLNFLPALSDIYQEKERRLKQKLKELIALEPRREMRPQNTTTRHFQESDEFEDDADKESRKRDRENRLKERNRRVSERTHSNKRRYRYEDSDEGISEKDESDEVMDSPSEARYVQDYYPLYSNGIDLKPAVMRLIGAIKVSKDASPFLEPVQKEEAPGYYEIVSQPIDLSIIMQKLLRGRYESISDLDADFRKLVSNCRLYHADQGPTKMAHNLYKIFKNGLLKIYEEHGIEDMSILHENEKTTAKHSKTPSKRNMKAKDDRRKKKRNPTLEALETLSREAELSVKRSNSSFKSLYVSKESRQCLKVVPIHSNPNELVERFMSDSSNQENDESSNNGSSCLGRDTEDSLQDFDTSHNSGSSSGSNDCIESHMDEENSNEPVFTEEDHTKNNNDHSGEEHISEPEIVPSRENSSSTPNSFHEDIRKASNSSTEGLLHGMANILEDCSNQSAVNAADCSFNSEPVFSAGEANMSPVNRSEQSDSQSRSSDSSTPENALNSSQETCQLVQSSIVEKHVPFLQEHLSIESNFESYPSSTNQPSTVDASILGFSSFANVPKGPPQLSKIPNNNASPPAQVTSTVATFTAHLSPSPKTAQPLHVDSYDKMFPYNNPVQVLKPEPTKFSPVAVSLPPSTGELLVLPDKSDPNKMTFHLLAQPHVTSSQPMQPCLELRANNSPEISRNQIPESTGEKTYKEGFCEIPPKRTSPLMEVPQYPNASYSMPFMLQPPMTSSFSSLLKPVTTYANYSSGTNFPSTADYNHNFMAVNNNGMPSTANSSPPAINSTSSPPYMFKADQQLPKQKSPNFISSRVNEDITTKSSSIVSYNAESINITTQTESIKPTSSNKRSAFGSSNQISKNTKALKSKSSASKRAATISQRLNASSPNDSPLYYTPNSNMPNGNGQYEIFLPRVNGNQQFSRLQTSDRQSNQNVLKTLPDGVSPSFYSSAYTDLQNFAIPSTSLNPHLIYTQVNNGQPSQFISLPSYMITNQNVFQHPPVNSSVMNVQPFQVPNRPGISMDLGSR